LDLWVEYATGFLFGWFIFQSLFMKNMMGGNYWSNVRKTFYAEFISMNAMMAGMAPVMTFLMMGRDMRAMDPLEPLFWLTMSIGISIGFVIAYPFNVWMVRKGMKHGLMTQEESKHSVHSHHHRQATSEGHQLSTTHSHKSHSMKDMHHAHQEHKEHESHKVLATRPQVMALTVVTGLMLIIGIVIPNIFVNTKLSAQDVGNVIMPPGMIMTRTLSGEAMKDMRAVLPHEVNKDMVVGNQGDLPLKPTLENGFKVFRLEADIFKWNILPNRSVDAYGFNGQVPGPQIRVNEGDRVQIQVTNHLPEPTSVHWHGLILDNAMDGAGDITQKPIQPGETYTYTFDAIQSGMYFYHSHYAPDRQQSLGLYGMLIIDPKDDTKNPQSRRGDNCKFTGMACTRWVNLSSDVHGGGVPQLLYY
ncbi:multicopper oxidase domain-containing protein, partial [Paenibacillus sp. AR247]|uniref:multicopper oxidase domain-containing protein n=1 Tax=Paenibacillus sp. AR247 TaxID=1631599 RepID=UPI001C616169